MKKIKKVTLILTEHGDYLTVDGSRDGKYLEDKINEIISVLNKLTNKK